MASEGPDSQDLSMHNWGDGIPGCENSPAKALRGEIGCVWARASNNEWVEEPGLK